jgi:hypothetical protein
LWQIGGCSARRADEIDGAAERREQPGEPLEQSRFAGAVRAADGEAFAGRDLAVEVMNGGAAIIAEGEIDQPDRRRVSNRAQCSAQ